MDINSARIFSCFASDLDDAPGVKDRLEEAVGFFFSSLDMQHFDYFLNTVNIPDDISIEWIVGRFTIYIVTKEMERDF